MPALSALFFTTRLGGGGAENHALRVMNGIDRDRVRPLLAVCRRGGSYEPFLRSDVPIFHASVGFTRSSLGLLALSAPRLRRLVRELAPDIVLAVMDMPALVAIAALGGMPRRPRLAACVQIAPGFEYARSRLGRALVLPGIRRLYPRADRVIALSLDERLLAPGDGGPASTRPVVVAAGRLTYQKSFADLVEAFALVRARVDAELWILGEGPERGAIEARVRQLGLGDAVRLLGFRDNPQAFFGRATVFALSSRYEGFGNVIVEALACGTPVVATDCPHGPAEILGGERGGLLVPVGDPGAMADALVRVLVDADLRRRLAAAGRVRAGDFTAAAIADAYASEIERICGRGAAGVSRGAGPGR